MEWGMTRDSTVYPMPNTFLPERWLNPSYPTYREPLSVYPRLDGHSQFGQGKRVCMGVDIVNNELLLVCGALAWAFNMKHRVDHNGIQVEVKDMEYSSLLIAKPDWFDFDLAARDEAKRQKIMEMWEDVEITEGLVSEKFVRKYSI
jgi:hypothetical protein